MNKLWIVLFFSLFQCSVAQLDKSQQEDDKEEITTEFTDVTTPLPESTISLDIDDDVIARDYAGTPVNCTITGLQVVLVEGLPDDDLVEAVLIWDDNRASDNWTFVVHCSYMVQNTHFVISKLTTIYSSIRQASANTLWFKINPKKEKQSVQPVYHQFQICKVKNSWADGILENDAMWRIAEKHVVDFRDLTKPDSDSLAQSGFGKENLRQVDIPVSNGKVVQIGDESIRGWNLDSVEFTWTQSLSTNAIICMLILVALLTLTLTGLLIFSCCTFAICHCCKSRKNNLILVNPNYKPEEIVVA